MHEIVSGIIAGIIGFIILASFFFYLYRNDIKKSKQRVKQNELIRVDLEKRFPKLFDINNWEMVEIPGQKFLGLKCKLTYETFQHCESYVPKYIKAVINAQEYDVIEQFLMSVRKTLMQDVNKRQSLLAYKVFGEDI